MMASNKPQSMVYRLRRCPAHLDKLGATQLLSQALEDIAPSDIRIQSLVMDLDPWARPPTQVGTLMFLKLPRLIEDGNERNEWRVPVVALEDPLLLDTHFLGMTPLNDVKREEHEFECIAISGLASHPFGSWAPKGGDKDFMWIRDELPRAMPNMRVTIYGYDTTLLKSNSFQSIYDLATSLINRIKAAGWAMPSSRPIVFLAHSLGGIVLKEAFSILADGHDQGMDLLSRFKGGIFFGVPSQGMATSHLLTMVQNQANEQIVRDLSIDSPYLRYLDDQFSGLAETKHMHIHWAYETKTSPTVIERQKKVFTRDGPEEILVSKDSATRSLYASRSSVLFPINENHSNIVKFGEGDPTFSIVTNKLKETCGNHGVQLVGGINTESETSNLVPRLRTAWNEPVHINQQDTSKHMRRQMVWTLEGLMASLRIPDANYRFDTIDEKFPHTLEWIFDKEETPLPKWLQDGDGLFWIHGKPGSGKSTLMKFIFKSQQTWELLHKFGSEVTQIHVSFFFHDRGSLIQKSFEGLLRSMLCQILEKARESGVDLIELLMPILSNHPRPRPQKTTSWNINELEHCIRLLFQQTCFDLEIFLLLDALDEFDGQPEFICRFLVNLMNKTMDSRTRLKLLFSSRPWEAFKQQFKTIPSIQLQDYTKDDIQKYSWGMIMSQEEYISATLRAVIPEIIRRAEGVFLWVKLVLRELIPEALNGLGPDDLTVTLNSIPSDLQEYYSRTSQRIPEIFRRDAYVIFSLLIAEESLPFSHMIGGFICSKGSTYKECYESREQSDLVYSIDWIKDNTQWKERILARTGGLIEVFENQRKKYNLQWAHQTVKEFAQSQDFRQSILGDRNRHTQENGHTFLAKYLLTVQGLPYAAEQLYKHEITTGRSMKSFLDSMPKEAFNHKVNLGRNMSLDGHLSFAMFASLQLYMKDTLASDPDTFRKTQEKLLSVFPLTAYLSFEVPLGSEYETHISLQRLILKNGYSLEKDPGSLLFVMQCQSLQMHESQRPTPLFHAERFMDLARFIIFEYFSNSRDQPTDFVYLSVALLFETGASLLVEHGHDPSTQFLVSCKTSGQPLSSLLYRNRPNYLQAMHLAKTVTLSRCLLEHGVDVNTLDTAGNTPLDHLLYFCGYVCDEKEAGEWQLPLYQTATLLIEHGGVARKIRREVWERSISWFEEGQLDITPLQECLNRLQFDNKGRPKRRWRRLIHR